MKETAISISSIPLCHMVTLQSTKYRSHNLKLIKREPADLKPSLTNKLHSGVECPETTPQQGDTVF